MPKSYPVITSRAATKDLENIKGQHADLLNGIASQAAKVATYNQQKSADVAAQNAMQMDMEKAKMVSNSQAQKNSLDFATKQAEIDIKRASLM